MRLLLALALIALMHRAVGIPSLLHSQNVDTEHTRYKSALGWRDCTLRHVLKPSGTDEIADAIQVLYRESTEHGKRFLVRAITPEYVGHNNFSCPMGAAGAVPLHAVGVDMSGMKAVVSSSAASITVQAGITFQELESVLLEKEQSLPSIIVVPSISEMTLGAAIATAAHGSSLVGPASLAPFITRAILVDGTGQVHTLEMPGDLLEGSMGMLGIITELTIETVPSRKVAVKQLQEEDIELVGDLRDIIENSEAVALDVTWSPSAGFYTARVWHETEKEMSGDSRATWLHASPDWLEATNRKLLADQDDLHDEGGAMCTVLGDIASMPHFSKADGWSEGDMYGVSVGWVNKMASVVCPNGQDCFWKRAKWTLYELAISSEDFADWVEDVRTIMGTAKGCPSFLFTFRFVMETDAPMAMSSGRQVVAIEIATFSGRGSNMPIKHAALFEEVVQMTLCKYQARPSWAFGTNRMFVGNCPVRDTLGPDFDAFLEARVQYDPASLFVSPLFGQIMARSVGTHYAGCAVAGDCWCQEDADCGRSYKCVPGQVFKEYNVCQAEVWSHKAEL